MPSRVSLGIPRCVGLVRGESVERPLKDAEAPTISINARVPGGDTNPGLPSSLSAIGLVAVPARSPQVSALPPTSTDANAADYSVLTEELLPLVGPVGPAAPDDAQTALLLELSSAIQQISTFTGWSPSELIAACSGPAMTTDSLLAVGTRKLKLAARGTWFAASLAAATFEAATTMGVGHRGRIAVARDATDLGLEAAMRTAHTEPSIGTDELLAWFVGIGGPDLIASGRSGAARERLVGGLRSSDVFAFTSTDDPRRAPSIGNAGLRRSLLAELMEEPDALKRLSPAIFEEVVRDRLDAMGFETVRPSGPYDADGGVDLLAFPRHSPVPWLMAVQIKHRSTDRAISSPELRELEGIVSRGIVNMGLLVTNTRFSPDAKWVAQQRPALIRLRDRRDVVSWMREEFLTTEIVSPPTQIELRPGLTITIPWSFPSQ